LRKATERRKIPHVVGRTFVSPRLFGGGKEEDGSNGERYLEKNGKHLKDAWEPLAVGTKLEEDNNGHTPEGAVPLKSRTKTGFHVRKAELEKNHVIHKMHLLRKEGENGLRFASGRGISRKVQRRVCLGRKGGGTDRFLIPEENRKKKDAITSPWPYLVGPYVKSNGKEQSDR